MRLSRRMSAGGWKEIRTTAAPARIGLAILGIDHRAIVPASPLQRAQEMAVGKGSGSCFAVGTGRKKLTLISGQAILIFGPHARDIKHQAGRERLMDAVVQEPFNPVRLAATNFPDAGEEYRSLDQTGCLGVIRVAILVVWRQNKSRPQLAYA